MSQWGAYGYARHGWSWRQILAHYYPGTQLGSSPDVRVRVLLAASVESGSVACEGRLQVSDATGRSRYLRAGTYGVGARLVLPVGPRGRGVALRSPVAFACAAAPVRFDGRSYRGALELRSARGRYSVVDDVPLEQYVLGVVGGEMPFEWSMDALEAQAVAARSYALTMLRSDRSFDLYADIRNQMYGGVAFETQRTDEAVAQTRGLILTWQGRPAQTYFFSSSGGRTANVHDVWPALGPLPYLRSVSDPYDDSPYAHWTRVLSPARVAQVLGASSAPASLRLVRGSSGRVVSVGLGSVHVSGERFEQALRLDSTWFSVGALTLTDSSARVVYGNSVGLTATATDTGPAVLQRLVDGTRWSTIARVHGRARIAVQPGADATFRLTTGRVAGPEVVVAVAPRLRVSPRAADLLAGSLEPRSSGNMTVSRLGAGGWQVVAHPLPDAQGAFASQLVLRPGAYRITVGADDRFASSTTTLRVTSRLLASLRR